MTNQTLNVVSVLEEGRLAVAQDRKTLSLKYDENTINILKEYIEQTYKHDFGKYHISDCLLVQSLIFLTTFEKAFTFIHHLHHLIRLKLMVTIS